MEALRLNGDDGDGGINLDHLHDYSASSPNFSEFYL